MCALPPPLHRLLCPQESFHHAPADKSWLYTTAPFRALRVLLPFSANPILTLTWGLIDWLINPSGFSNTAYSVITVQCQSAPDPILTLTWGLIDWLINPSGFSNTVYSVITVQCQSAPDPILTLTWGLIDWLINPLGFSNTAYSVITFQCHSARGRILTLTWGLIDWLINPSGFTNTTCVITFQYQSAPDLILTLIWGCLPPHSPVLSWLVQCPSRCLASPAPLSPPAPEKKIHKINHLIISYLQSCQPWRILFLKTKNQYFAPKILIFAKVLKF